MVTGRVDGLEQTVRVNVAYIARGCRSGLSHNPAVHEQAVDAALAELAALARERDLLTCPYCAHSFVPQEGRTYESCPGCKRAHLEEDECDRLAARVGELAQDAQEILDVLASGEDPRAASGYGYEHMGDFVRDVKPLCEAVAALAAVPSGEPTP